ncbi:MAG: hypothetical protein WBA28_09945 [Microbacteriaceae bacterium]
MAITVAIVGSGRLGTAIGKALARCGVKAEFFSRSTGFDVTQSDSERSFGQVDVVIEATDVSTMNAKVAKEFFSSSTRAISQAAKNSSASKHILISIVNCEKPEVQGYGYYAGKSEQERVARKLSENLTIVRSTQWFEFAKQITDRLKVGPLRAVPNMLIQPVALDAVADIVAECALGERNGSQYDLAGPDIMTMKEMARRVLPNNTSIIAIPLPGPAGKAFRSGALLADTNAEVEIIGPHLEEWIAQQQQ